MQGKDLHRNWQESGHLPFLCSLHKCSVRLEREYGSKPFAQLAGVFKNAFHLWQITERHKQLETLWGEDRQDIMFGFIDPPHDSWFPLLTGLLFPSLWNILDLTLDNYWLSSAPHMRRLSTWVNPPNFFFKNELGKTHCVRLCISICNSLWLSNDQVINQCQITFQSTVFLPLDFQRGLNDNNLLLGLVVSCEVLW